MNCEKDVLDLLFRACAVLTSRWLKWKLWFSLLATQMCFFPHSNNTLITFLRPAPPTPTQGKGETIFVALTGECIIFRYTKYIYI